MNRPKAHRLFIITSIYLLGLIIIMFFFLWPQLKDRFGKSMTLEEDFPMLLENYSSQQLRASVLWKKTADQLFPIINNEEYDTYYVYQENILSETDNATLTLGVYMSKNHYVIVEHNDTYRKLYGLFK